jgi:peroxiredoxin
MLALGTPLPAFTLPEPLTGKAFDSGSLAGKVSVIAFLCNHCPYVKHIQRELAAFGRECAERGVALVGISSNDVATYPQDGPHEMAAEARSAGYVFPYLYDESQAVARAFDAACTPELYVFGRDGKLAYRGRFDESTPKNGVPVTGRDARAAVEALLRGEAPGDDQRPSIGCSIKWK